MVVSLRELLMHVSPDHRKTRGGFFYLPFPRSLTLSGVAMLCRFSSTCDSDWSAECSLSPLGGLGFASCPSSSWACTISVGWNMCEGRQSGLVSGTIEEFPGRECAGWVTATKRERVGLGVEYMKGSAYRITLPPSFRACGGLVYTSKVCTVTFLSMKWLSQRRRMPW